ncbi:tRNA (carboxymethyluridine(34)-5-O)-methyltransferase [Cladobotryum mycophilum]|uniref:tRNA (Carboxymethyluridine(34)-5-O)-methyltransferase n=1 Tax=Cladobotryum mycophilum TaxID=491253 RepID=A0ABR0SXX1_9HYPO
MPLKQTSVQVDQDQQLQARKSKPPGSSSSPPHTENDISTPDLLSHMQASQEEQERQDDDGAGAAAAAAATTTSSSTSSSSSAGATAEEYEATHVHSVYEAIAPHFSSTRHKPWPLVTNFLLTQAPGSVGLDVGCGNGKYLPVNPSLHIFGSDRSANLVHLARTERNGEVVVADGLSLPYRQGAVDFVISVAVIHHLSTRERRQEGIAALLRCVRRGGRVLVYAWALEQSSSRRGWDEGSEQDALVPWVMRTKGKPEATYQRYYHLYRKGELEEDVIVAGGTVLESGYEKDNWWVIGSNGNA